MSVVFFLMKLHKCTTKNYIHSLSLFRSNIIIYYEDSNNLRIFLLYTQSNNRNYSSMSKFSVLLLLESNNNITLKIKMY